MPWTVQRNIHTLLVDWLPYIYQRRVVCEHQAQPLFRLSLSPISLRTYRPINDWTTIRRRESYRSTTYPLSQVWYTCVRAGWQICIGSGYASVCAVGRYNCVLYHVESSSYNIDLVDVRKMSRNTLGWLSATAWYPGTWYLVPVSSFCIERQAIITCGGLRWQRASARYEQTPTRKEWIVKWFSSSVTRTPVK